MNKDEIDQDILETKGREAHTKHGTRKHTSEEHVAKVLWGTLILQCEEMKSAGW